MRAKRSTPFLSTLQKHWLRYGAVSTLVAAGLAIGMARPGAPVEPHLAMADVATSVTSNAAGVNPPAPGGASDAPRGARSTAISHRESKPKIDRISARRDTKSEHNGMMELALGELERLQAQEPTNFLAVFDMMHDEGRWSEQVLDSARRASHAYIIARMGILERMLRRYIDDPQSDETVESDDLARIDADFQKRMDSLSRDVPPLENVQALLTTTILKAPAFTEPSARPESPETSEQR